MEHFLSSSDNLGGRTWDPNYTSGALCVEIVFYADLPMNQDVAVKLKSESISYKILIFF